MLSTNQSALSILTWIVFLLVLLHTCHAQQGVCYSRLSRQQSYSSYINQVYTVYSSCEWWSRCSRTDEHFIRWWKLAGFRTRYRMVLVTRYRTDYLSQRRCCTGYQSCNCQSCSSGCQLCNSGCCPICNDCDTNHTCIAPYLCVCPAGWTGPDCQTVSPSTAANEYYVGFFNNYRGPGNMTLYITTTESVPVPFTVSSSTGLIHSGTATNTGAINVTLPTNFAVEDNAVRDKGVWIHAADTSKKLTVHAMNILLTTVNESNSADGSIRIAGATDDGSGSTTADEPTSADGFVALPCYDFQKQNYTFYTVSTYFTRTSERLASQVLLLACKNDTEVTITSTQTIEIPSDLVRGGNSSITVNSGSSYTITLNRLQTFLFTSTLDLTGSKVVSNKPVAFFSGHECADVPVGVQYCDHLVEQLPPTVTWGRLFFVVSLLNATAGEQYKLITSTATTTVVCYCYISGGSVSQIFGITINGDGTSYEFQISQNMFCSVQASSPVLLLQFSVGESHSSYGDPFMMMIPPVEQQSYNYTFVAQSGFQNAITVTVASEYFHSNDIILNNKSLSSANWTEIYCSTQTVCAYGTRMSISEAGRNFIYHRDETARLGTFVYGFAPFASYGYPAGMQLIPISGVCQPGTIQLVATQSEGTGLVQVCLDGSWTYVCGNGWSNVDAGVACRQLGYSFYYAGKYTASSGDGNTVPLLFSNVRCSGSETMLTSCAYDSNLGDCTLTQPAAGVICNTTLFDCGPPVPPRNGSLESYTSTTEGSEVFYSCDPDHLREGRMRAVCTDNGWSPNPTDLSCTLVSPSTAANEYYVGFFRNYRELGDMTLYITTTESVPVPFTVSSSTGQLYFGNVTDSVARSVILSGSFAVTDSDERDKGVWIHATDAITVHGMNNASGSADGFVALPCYDYQEQNYVYYAVSTYFNRTSYRSISQILLVGCEESTELTITPTQMIQIPFDLATGENSSLNVTSGTSYVVTLDRFQTVLFTSTLDLTGSKVVSNKPIAFFSGHECADVPVGVAYCDHLVEQLPPTLTWGRQFFVASSLGKTAGEQYKLITSTATTTVSCYCYTSGGSVSQTFMTTLNGNGSSYEFYITQNMFCSVQTSSPILLVQFAIGRSREPSYYGDPFMMMIPPVEQYSNNYTFVTQSGFQNAITIIVASQFLNSADVVLNGSSVTSASWTRIYCSTQRVCAYGTRIPVSVGRNFIFHRDPTTKLGTFVYGFTQNAGYGYPAGMQLVPIPGNCGPPVPPHNGSLESYSNTAEGSEVFYSCNSGHFPDGRMRAVCTENEWNPNPADLSCTIGDCGQPIAPRNGSLESYTSTTHGSEVFYSCDPGHLPEGRMRGVCTDNGWSPNPADLICTAVISGTPTIPPSETSSSIVAGAATGGSIAGIIAVLVPIIAFLTWGIYYRRRKMKSSSLHMREIKPLSTHTYVGDANVEMQQFDKHRAKEKLNEEATRYLQEFPEEKIFHTSNLHLLEMVGQGEFGIVYRARLTRPTIRNTDCKIVAVKTIKGFLDPSDVADFLKECLKMKAFVHPHVMGILGICLDGQTPYIVMPFMANGSLHTYLRKHRMELLISKDEDIDLICNTRKRMLDMCLQIAKGMEYLTGHNLVHRDLAARNCMLDQNYVIKVADFGLSEKTYTKDYFRQKQTTGVKLPMKWMAYESLSDGIFSEKTDVWSFGVTCWEIFSTAKTPYPGIHPTSLIAQLENGERLPKPNNAACCDSMYEVMRSCWDADPKQRPTFSQLVTTITSVLNSLADYLEVTTFVTEEQATNEMEKGKCDKEASQERDQTTETHFLTSYVVKNEGAEECAK